MPRRILFLVTDLEIGGTPRVVRDVSARVGRGRGAHIEVACLSKWGPVADEIQSDGHEVTALGAGSIAALPITVARLARLVRNRSIDTIFSFLVHANTCAAIVCRFKRSVRSIQAIQTTQARPRWHWWAQGLVSHIAERVVVPSLSVANMARERAHVPEEKIVVIPNAVDAHQFDGLARPFHMHAPGQPVQVGFIGRLDPIKRLPDLIEAVRLLSGGVHLHVFGEGEERPHIEQLIARLHLKHQVTLHGAIERPHDALKQIDLLVLPSDAEGFGMVLIEAMAAGVPVVGTDVPGIRDVVQSEATGLLVPARSPAAIALAIRRLMEDAQLRKTLMTGARTSVEDHFGWTRVVRKYCEVLGI